MWKMIDGYKTYIGMIAAGIFGIGVSMGWLNWDDPITQAIAAAIATWTGVALKHSQDKKTTK